MFVGGDDHDDGDHEDVGNGDGDDDDDDDDGHDDCCVLRRWFTPAATICVHVGNIDANCRVHGLHHLPHDYHRQQHHDHDHHGHHYYHGLGNAHHDDNEAFCVVRLILNMRMRP